MAIMTHLVAVVSLLSCTYIRACVYGVKMFANTQSAAMVASLFIYVMTSSWSVVNMLSGKIRFATGEATQYMIPTNPRLIAMWIYRPFVRTYMMRPIALICLLLMMYVSRKRFVANWKHCPIFVSARMYKKVMVAMSG